MGIIIDVLILLLFLRFVMKNYKRPQLRCGIETICFVLAAALAVPICIMLSSFCYELIFRDVFCENIANVVSSSASMESTVSRYSLIMDELPSVIRNGANGYQTNTDAVIAEVERIIQSEASDAAERIIDLVARPVLEGVFRGTFCLIFFIGLQYLLTSIGAVVENALYTPERAIQNPVLCGVLGCFKCLTVVTVIITALQLILPALPPLPLLNAEALGSSFLFRLFYHQNILMLFLGNGIYAMNI